MSIEAALVAHCTSYPALVALIGDRFEPQPLSEFSELPAICYGRAGVRPTQHRDSARANHGRTRFQFDLWGATPLEVINVREAFREAMGAFQQGNNPRVDVTLLQDDRDAPEVEAGKWRSIVDYHIYHTE